jgi:hypothetical protein
MKLIVRASDQKGTFPARAGPKETQTIDGRLNLA